MPSVCRSKMRKQSLESPCFRFPTVTLSPCFRRSGARLRGKVARKLADHLQDRTGADEGTSEDYVELGLETGERRRRRDARQRFSRSVGLAGEPSRRLGEWSR